MRQPDLILFAKQPRPGAVKTRLTPTYTAEQAAQIAASLIRATVELAVSSWPGEVYLCGAPDANHPLFHELAGEFSIKLASQADGDLGRKMWCALRDGIARQGSAAVLGCDVPHCSWEILDHANDRLVRGRNLLGPTEDGGYYFIGLQHPWAELFSDIEWGGCRVLGSTLQHAEKIGVEFELLTTLTDIDTASDLWLATRKLDALRRFLIPQKK